MEVVICLLLLAAPSDRADRAARRILADPSYQTELPGEAAPHDEAHPSGEEADERVPEPAPPVNPTEVRDAFATIARLVWWIVIGVVGATALLWLVRELAARYERRPPPAEVPRAVPETAPPAPVDPEGLAAAGRYGEAIHALLLRVLLELRRRREIRPAWTSREVVRHVPLQDAVRDRLCTLVHAVERTHFGGVPADAQEYRRRATDAAALLAGIARGSRG